MAEQAVPALGVSVTVVGEIVPYSFADKDTGEAIGLVHLRVPGSVVSVDVSPELSEKIREGEVWEVVGPAVVRASKGRIHIARPVSMKRHAVSRTADGPVVDFGDAKKAG